MRDLKAEFVRITTKDNLELHGILYEPERKTTKALIHVHSWIGNFYENKFIDCIAKEAVRKKLAFLTFNNRGTGMVTDLIRRKKSKIEYVRIGGSLEKFGDCIIDIKAAVDFLSKRGYKKIILQGHSLSCQKITFYKYKTRDKRVKYLIELAPVDDVGYVKRTFGKKYKKSLKIAKKMIKKGKGNEPVPKWMEFYPLLSASRFLDVADPETLQGRIFNYSGELKEIKNVGCPVLAVFGSRDEYESNSEDKLKILKKDVKNCDTRLVKKAGHWFAGFEAELSKIVCNWIEKCIK